jgi:hypothetical protein
MSFLNRYKTDKRAETEGVWVEIDTGVELKVARVNNEKAREMRRKLEKPYASFRVIPDSVNEDIFRKIVSNHVLLDWKGITDADGKEIKFSVEAAEKVLKDYPDFFNDVLSLAGARETFQDEATDAAKNA